MVALREILIVDLYEAIESDNPNLIRKGLKREEFEVIVSEYLELQRGAPTVKERRKQGVEARVNITTHCLIYLSMRPLDEDIMVVLRQNNWKIEAITYGDDIKRIMLGLEQLRAKLELLDQDGNRKTGNDKKMSIYDILASMSAGLEGIYLDPRKITVKEFVSYQEVLRKKSDRYEKSKKATQNDSR